MVLLVLCGVTFAQKAPAEAARKVAAAFKAGDRATLAKIAGTNHPDPWLVAYELCADGHHDAAAALA
ncbi:MAG: hypothetical protein OER88_00125, partial [Planctomycetota bacterium]|nr:hypothetical protein [Planctomycetota bacterium]